jgi:outer membrane protein assembly factor BamB
MYMHDAGRSGVTAARIDAPLTEQWVHRAPAEPRPAWPDSQHGWPELPRSEFDDAFYTAAVGDKVFFGSSVDVQIDALDAATGTVRWKFFHRRPRSSRAQRRERTRLCGLR